MKKLLLLLVLFLGTSYYSNAQVIDIVGKGIHDQPNANLQFTDIDNIDHIDVGVIKSWGPPIPAENVKFSNYLGSKTATLSLVTINKNPYGYTPGELLTASFSEVDASGIDVAIDDGGLSFSDFIQSYFAFVYRDITDSNIKSFKSLETVYFFVNGSGDPYVYDITIDAASYSRDITVKIPISELQNDSRPAIIDITAGSMTHPTVSVTTYEAAPISDLGNSLFIGEYVLTDVPGDVTNIAVSIYSPKSNGDSFYVSGVVVDVEIVPEGCTLTQGYWKTHSDCKTNGNGKGNGPERDTTWDLIGPDNTGEMGENSIFIEYEGEDEDEQQTYCQVFDTNPGKGGKYYILAHQYIAAELNILNGASPYPSAFDKAKLFLEDNTPTDVKGNKSLEAICVELGEILADFNEGAIGPGHCDDDETASKILDVDELESIDDKVKIYPNPATSIGRINFVPKENAETTVEVYNILGQRVSVLYNEYTMGGVPVTVDYDAQRFKQGIHFVHIKNGSSTATKKLSIIK